MYQLNDLIYLIHVQDFNNIKKCIISEINSNTLILKDFDEELYYHYDTKNKTLGIRIFKNKKQNFGVFHFEILASDEKELLYNASKLTKDIKNIATQSKFLENKSLTEIIDHIEYVNGLKILLEKMRDTLDKTNLKNKNNKFVRV